MLRQLFFVCLVLVCVTTQSCNNIDFDVNPNNIALNHGYKIDATHQPWQPWGVTLSTSNPAEHPLKLFNSQSPPTTDACKVGAQYGDPDLCTPNSGFGGPGISNDGSGGPGHPGANSVGQGNILIINEYDDDDVRKTDDWQGGGFIYFTFDTAITVYGMAMIDADAGEVDNYVALYSDTAGTNEIARVNLPALGDNSYQYVFVNLENNLAGISGVRKMVVFFRGSGSISEVTLCPPSSTGLAAIGDTVWWDQDRDANYEPENGEQGLSGVLVIARYCGETKAVSSAYTDSTGYYLIGNLPPECYEVIVPEWKETPANQLYVEDINQTFDFTSTFEVCANVNLDAGDIYLECDFGYDNDLCPNDCIDNNICTSDACVNGVCVNNPVADYVIETTNCGVGACASTGKEECVGGVYKVTPCAPGTPASDDATCNGIDEDCDGFFDEDFPTSTTTCGTGACLRTGETKCQGGTIVNTCTPGSGSSDNNCDGIDNDCDGLIDEDYVGEADTCGLGYCQSTGVTTCKPGGVLGTTCEPGTPESADDASCDGVDNDCDGATDEDFQPVPTTCGVGACSSTGTETCIDGVLHDSCQEGTPSGTDNNCNNIDEDCDGQVDEEFVGETTTCGTGECVASGQKICENGIISDTCSAPTPDPSTIDNTCDGIDEDCDGTADQDYEPTETTCGEGVCQKTGSLICSNGSTVDTCLPGAPQSSTDETCDGIDQDCDGAVDDDYIKKDTTCGVGECASTGETSCENGQVVDSCTPQTPEFTTDEVCDGLDEDCDGKIDDDYPVTQTTCGEGPCQNFGEMRCVNGQVVDTCEAILAETDIDDTCDGIDQNCNGEIDENYQPVAVTCGVGVCENSGQTKCVNGFVEEECTPLPPNSNNDDNCDAIDDNCNGENDENYNGDETTCGLGVCTRTGNKICVNGAVEDTCVPGNPTASDDSVCDGFDSDCDGEVDEDYVSLDISCGVGACFNTGKTVCVDGKVVQDCTPLDPISSDDATCDGVDDNCNGQSDEDYVNVATSCGLGICTSSGQDICVDGTIVDTCQPGNPSSSSDTNCNNLDEDCDGQVDEDFNSLTTYCGVGECEREGQTSCENGVIVDSCTPGTPAAEDSNCDGKDDNCDGKFDEQYPETPTTCGIGACANSGVETCIDGVVVDTCTLLSPSGLDDTCNNIDEDCDGDVDEDYVVVETTCGVGACTSKGVRSCVNGQVVDSCVPGTPANGDSTCNGIDDNCNGEVDEDFVKKPITCGLGSCVANGEEICDGGKIVPICTPGTPSPDDNCNNIDEDCDGQVDEDFVVVETECGDGVCVDKGKRECINGEIVDTCERSSPSGDDSTCNGVDENCDGLFDNFYVPVQTTCGVGVCATTGVTTCVNGVVSDSCVPLAPLSADDSDCDGKDSNCNGLIDENSPCDDDRACTRDFCTPNGCVHDDTLCNAPCHNCEYVTRSIFSINNQDVGNVTFTYNGEYTFFAQSLPGWLIEEVHLGIFESSVDQYDMDYDFGDIPRHYENVNAESIKVRVDSPTDCGEDHIIVFVIRAKRVNSGESILAYANGDIKPSNFEFPVFIEHRACCNPSVCPICFFDTDCQSDNPCNILSCISDSCVVTGNNCAAPDVPEPPPVNPPQATGVVELPPPAPPVNPPAGTTAAGSSAATGNSGASAINNQAEGVIAGTPSTLVIGGVGAGVVGFFAIFGAVIGLNNTKKDPEVPLAAVLEETESGASAFINPTFVDNPDAFVSAVADGAA